MDVSLLLDQLFREHSHYVAGVATRLLGRDDEVGDVVQDVFIQAMKDLPQLRNPDAARAWLAQIAVRTARRRLRKRRFREIFLPRPEEAYAHIASPGVGPERATELRNVYRALDALGVDDRLAWVLRHIEGHPLEDAAQLCGCSLATVKRRVARADAQLRRRLDVT